MRDSLYLEQVPVRPCGRYLLSGPTVPVTATAGDGSATFDGERVRITWNWSAHHSKKSAGIQVLALTDIADVEWSPVTGGKDGYLRFRVEGATTTPPLGRDPHCLRWSKWGLRREGERTTLLAAAVKARLLNRELETGLAVGPA